MFVFDKRLDPEQAINFKPSSKAAFGFMQTLSLGTTASAVVAPIFCHDPSQLTDVATGETAATVPNAMALLTRVHWDLGATDPICIEGLTTVAVKQAMVALLYGGLIDITVKFTVAVYEYDPVITPKKYYGCFLSGAATPTELTGKLLKSGDRELAIEIGDDEEVIIQDNAFYSFSMKIVPALSNQIIVLAASSGGSLNKIWGRTS